MSLLSTPTTFVSDPATAAAITAATDGCTVASWFADTVARLPDGPALRDGERSWTWSQYGRAAASAAAGFRSLGLRPGDRVALMMRNRPEFHFADIGALLAGLTPFSIYNSSAPEQLRYLLGHSEARALVVEDAEFLERVQRVRHDLVDLEHVLVVDADAADANAFGQLLCAEPVDLQAAAAAVAPSDLAMLTYTSGTTGPPKGAMSSHDRICWIMESFRRALGVDLSGKQLVSYLPMAHVLERDVGHYLHVLTGAEVTTCPDPARVAEYLVRVRPHFFAAVPRVWEKLASALRTTLGDQLSASAARAQVGLDRCEVAFSGGAPLPGEALEFLRGLGVPLGEGYGLTESTFIVSFDARTPRTRAVGRALPGVELAVAEDGEVLTRGPFVFGGYFKDPERSAEAVDAEGWLHTGDIGKLDEDGYLWIVDRKKELIITAGGKNVSPSNLEAALKAHPLIGQACVIGDNRPYLCALIVLDVERAPRWAAERGLDAATALELADDPVVRDEIQAAVATLNERVSRAEGIKRFALLGREWLPDSDELTPTMKLKRRGILARHAGTIEALYADQEL